MPEQLGKYTLEKRIGAGGMADVFLAQGPDGVCVVKRPHPHLCSSPEFVRMFLDEASLVAQLHHPGIASLFDLGQVNGVYYLAMEYVPGYDLMTISLEHERHGEYMAPELAARVMADAATALHYAHDALSARGQPLNIIHRDVTPHNILLSRSGEVKIIDFGVAKAANTMHRTQAGLVKGKYPYMSPEQITGQRIDRRVDVYALGLVLYELLTNARAIAGEMEVEQIENARHMRIKPVEQLRPNTPEPLKIILNSCFQMNPEKRYPTAGALAADLEKYLVYEGHKVGREDLLRLFRGVAAEQGGPSEEIVPAAPTEKTYNGPKPGPVASSKGGAVNKVLATDAAAAKTDVEVPSNASMPRPPMPQGLHLGGAAVLKLGEGQVAPSPAPQFTSVPTDKHVAHRPGAATLEVPGGHGGLPDTLREEGPAPVPQPLSPSQVDLPVLPPSRPPVALMVVGLVLAVVVAVLAWKVVQGSGGSGGGGDPVVVMPAPTPTPTPPEKTPDPPIAATDPDPPPPVAKEPEPPVAAKNPDPPVAAKNPSSKPAPVIADVTYSFRGTPGVAVDVDGKPRGATPVEVPLKPGKHHVLFVDKASGQRSSQSFVVKAGAPDSIEWTAPQKPPSPPPPPTQPPTQPPPPAVAAKATLQLEATPYAHKYLIDGKQVAGQKSFHELEVSEGRHTIEFILEDPTLTKTIKRVVELKGGTTDRVKVNFLSDS